MTEKSLKIGPDTSRRYKIAVIAPSCFYYHAPLYRKLAACEDVDLKVYFCSDEALEGRQIEIQFGASATWGLEDVLSGYQYEFLENNSPTPSYLKSLVGLLNRGIWKAIERDRPDLVVLMAWINPTWWLAVAACKYFDINYVFMTDQNIQNEANRSGLKAFFKNLVLRRIIFPTASGFLSSGIANDRFYQRFNVPQDKIIPFAFSWGYEEIIQVAEKLRGDKALIREELGLGRDQFVVLFAGRFVPEKDLMTLIRAYKLAAMENSVLMFIGDGGLKTQLTTFASQHDMDDVMFFGFKNRQEISRFFSVADVVVLPSIRETWGLVVNEALCFSVPVILSDQVGSVYDLVDPAQNGFVFIAGDATSLADKLETLHDMPIENRRQMRAKSLQKITDWINRDNIGELLKFTRSTVK